MSEEYYKQKYLKYKKKYLELQQQIGGINPLKYIPGTGSHKRHLQKKARHEQERQKLITETRIKALNAKKEADKLKRIKEASELVNILAQQDNHIYKVSDFIGPFPSDYFDRYGQEISYDESDFMEDPSKETYLYKLRKYSDIFEEDGKIYEILLSSRQK